MRSLFALTLRGALLAVFHVRSGFISGAAIKGILERMASIKGGRALCFLRKSSFAATFNFKVVESPKYRPDIDGLRAIAVLPVLLYHAGVAGFSGGYVGVDIFFVISGFLIASIITKDIELKRFSFLSFYERRMRRIFPALFAVALFCVAAATILFEPKDFIQFGKSLLAMAAFISNLFFWRQAGTEGYFGFSSVLALLHTWSLSVEEQFYIFFPVSLILLRRWAKGYASNCLLFVIAASFAVSAWEAIYRPFSAFYLLAPRAWELLIGAFLAMQPMPPLNGRVVRELAGIAGLGMIAYAIVAFDRQTDFPGLNALFPCLGAWLIIYAGKDGASYVKTLLSLSPLVFIGVISYSLYLWHWPIIIFSKHFFVRALSDKETVIVLLCSLLAGFISFVFIESPFRRKESAVSRRQVYGFGIAASIVSITLGFLIYWYQGFPQRHDETTSQIVMKNSTRKSDYDRRCGNFSADVHTIADMDLCKIGSETSHDVLFWGDSQVQQLLPLVERMHAAGKLPGKGFIFAIEVPADRASEYCWKTFSLRHVCQFGDEPSRAERH
jgi:peptidoglycan/LPS O-acetylase OafA/YrhL